MSLEALRELVESMDALVATDEHKRVVKALRAAQRLLAGEPDPPDAVEHEHPDVAGEDDTL